MFIYYILCINYFIHIFFISHILHLIFLITHVYRKDQIKRDNRESTIRKLHGGNITAVPPDSQTVPCPVGLSKALWIELEKCYNNSQLYAIKVCYICVYLSALE